MAEALVKRKDGNWETAGSSDTDGLLVTALLEALSGTDRLNVGTDGRTEYSPSNYSTTGEGIDEHLTGIDNALGSCVESGDSAGGDLAGTYPNPDVAKIQGYAVQDHAPLDGEALVWNNSNSQYEPEAIATLPAGSQYQVLTKGSSDWEAQWPGMVNESGNKTFVILDAGTSIDLINTALTNYDIVYLEVGVYTHNGGATVLEVPRGKMCIGLGSAEQRDGSYCVRINILGGSSAGYFCQLKSGWIENIWFDGSGTYINNEVVNGSSTANEQDNVANRVHVTSATMVLQQGFEGYFSRISNWYTYRLGIGCYITGNPDSGNGSILIENFKTSENGYGAIVIAGTVSDILIRNGIVGGSGNDYAVTCTPTTTIYNHTIENIRLTDSGSYGIQYNSAGSVLYGLSIKNVSIHGTTGAADIGFDIRYVQRLFMTDCYAEDCNGSTGAGYGGVSLQYCYDFTLKGITTNDCDNTSNAGVVLQGCSRGSLSDLNDYQSVYGLFVTTSCSYIVGTNINSYDAVTTGVYVNNSPYSSWSSISVYSAGVLGVSMTGTGSSLSGATAYSGCTAGGIYFNCTASTASALTANSVTGYGVRFGSYQSVSGVYVYNSGSYGVYSSNSDYGSYTGLYVYSAANIGIYFSGSIYMVGSAWFSYDCGDGSNEYGIYLLNSQYGTFTGLHSHSSYAHGIFFNNCDYTVATGLNSRLSGSYGIYVSACSYSTFGTLNVTNSSSYGIVFSGANTRSVVHGVVAYSNTTRDLSFGAPSTEAFLFGTINQAGKDVVDGGWNWQVAEFI